MSTGSGGHRDRDRDIKKRAAIGNTVRGFLSSGHSRQDRYNDVCIKNHASYIVICYTLLLSYKVFFIIYYFFYDKFCFNILQYFALYIKSIIKIHYTFMSFC